MLFFDSIPLTSKFNSQPKRFEATLAVPGVFTYIVNGQRMRHYRPLEEIFSDSTVSSLQDVIVTIDHPIDDTNPAQGVGAVITANRDPTTASLSGSVLLLNDEAVTLAKNGSQVSPKFEADVYPQSGIWYDSNGKPHPYEAIQRNIKYRSLGLVGTNGRQGEQAKIYRQLSADSNIAIAEILNGDAQMNLTQESLMAALQKLLTTTENNNLTIPTATTVADTATATVTPPPIQPVQQTQPVTPPSIQPVQQTQPINTPSNSIAPVTQSNPSITPIQIQSDPTTSLSPTIQSEPQLQSPTPHTTPTQPIQQTQSEPQLQSPVLDPTNLTSALKIAQMAIDEGLSGNLNDYLYKALTEPTTVKNQILNKYGIKLDANVPIDYYFDGFIAAKNKFQKQSGKSKSSSSTLTPPPIQPAPQPIPPITQTPAVQPVQQTQAVTPPPPIQPVQQTQPVTPPSIQARPGINPTPGLGVTPVTVPNTVTELLKSQMTFDDI